MFHVPWQTVGWTKGIYPSWWQYSITSWFFSIAIRKWMKMAHRLYKNDDLPNLKNGEFPSWFRMAHRLYKNDDLPNLKNGEFPSWFRMAHRLYKNDDLPNLKNGEFPSWFRMAHRLYKNDDLPNFKTVNFHHDLEWLDYIRMMIYQT